MQSPSRSTALTTDSVDRSGRGLGWILLKDRIRAEELLGDLRTQELMDARSVINAQESLLDYSTKELHDAKMTLTARENVQELGRVEAIQLHEELDRLREVNKNLEKRIELLQKEYETFKKKR